MKQAKKRWNLQSKWHRGAPTAPYIHLVQFSFARLTSIKSPNSQWLATLPELSGTDYYHTVTTYILRIWFEKREKKELKTWKEAVRELQMELLLPCNRSMMNNSLDNILMTITLVTGTVFDHNVFHQWAFIGDGWHYPSPQACSYDNVDNHENY